MHVYFALRRGQGEPGAIVGEVSRPVLFGGLVTLASFGVMLHSSLPGQRQLAVYSMIGVAASLLISLVVLPHLIPPAPRAEEPQGPRLPRVHLPRTWILAGWVLLLALSASQIGKLRFNGDMRALNLVPADLRAAEVELQRAWGDLRGKALVFAEGKSLEEALEKNDRLFAFLRDTVPEGELVSLAPLVPSEETQRENRARWAGFWTRERLAGLQASLAEEGTALGFSDGAFEPFLARLRAPAQPVTLEGLAAAGLGEVVGSLVLRADGRVRVLTLVPDTPAVVALFDSPRCPPGVHAVSQTRFGTEIGQAIGRDFTWYLAVTLVLVIALVVLVFRDAKKSLLALVPVVTGLVAMFGAMGLLGIEFNLFNIVATILIIGLCADYGIYMVCKVSEGAEHAADRAVLVSGLTTLAGFGALVLARHPAMHSIGVTVLFGIGAAIPCALFVIPALWGPGSASDVGTGRGH
jgi:predicted exporter